MNKDIGLQKSFYRIVSIAKSTWNLILHSELYSVNQIVKLNSKLKFNHYVRKQNLKSL